MPRSGPQHSRLEQISRRASPEKDLGSFTIGDVVSVRVDAHPEPLRATVTWVSPEAEFTPKNVQTKDARAELVYAVKVTIESPPAALKIGMPAEVYLQKP